MRIGSGTRLGFAASAVLLAATFLLFRLYDGYEDRGRNLLEGLDPGHGLAGWKVERTAERLGDAQGTMILRNAEPDGGARLTASLALPEAPFVRLSAELRTEAVAAGHSKADRARFALLGLDEAGRHLSDYPHMVAELAGSQDWSRYQRVFPVSREFASLAVVLELNRATGALMARELSLVETVPKPLFQALRWVIVGLWAAFLLWLAARFLPSRRPRAAHALLLFAAAVILAGTLAPKHEQSKLSQAIAGVLARPATETQVPAAQRPEERATEALSAPARGASSAAPLDAFTLAKIAHLASFALLGLALALARPRAPLALLLAALAVAAVSSEALQEFNPTRDPLLTDVGLDFGGAALGLLAAAAAGRLLGRPTAGPG